jgi:hypothetical protein
MTQTVELDGVRHDFPDDATQAEIARVLSTHDAAPKSGDQSLLSKAIEPITSIPKTYRSLVDQATELFGKGFGDVKSGSPLKGVGEMALGGLEYVTAPINAPIHTIIGKPVADVTGSETAGNAAELAAGIMLPVPKGFPRLSRTPAPVAAPARMMDVTLSEGQASRELPQMQREQAAVRGRSGPPAQSVAQEFVDQQQTELAAARDKLARGLDPFGARVAETPQEAGEIVSQSVRDTAASRKADVNAAYKEARGYPGEIHAGAFEGIGQKIKGDLSLRDEPVIIDGKLTPFASQMIDDLEQRVSRLKIENRADPFGPPNPENITGINLQGVNQMRKRLSTMRKDAFGSGNAADGRAAKAVLDAFDDQIDAAINGGLFKGDQRAIGAWNNARAAYADYRGTFTAGKNDPVGRVVEKIIGKDKKDPAIPNDVADFLYGSAGINPSSLNVGVVKRLQSILGDQSPEWSAIRQGLFARITEAGPGVTELGPGKVAQRINRFLSSDGKEMANLVFTPAQRDLMQKYADLMRHIEVPQAGANWSNTAAFAAQGYVPNIASRALNMIGSSIGSLVGGHLGGVAGGAATAKISGMSGQAREAREIARMMPVIGKVTKQFTTSATAAQSSPTPRNVARLMLATRNLANNLKSIGVSISPDDLVKSLQGPQSTNADETQQQPPRVGNTQPNPGQ